MANKEEKLKEQYNHLSELIYTTRFALQIYWYKQGKTHDDLYVCFINVTLQLQTLATTPHVTTARFEITALHCTVQNIF